MLSLETKRELYDSTHTVQGRRRVVESVGKWEATGTCSHLLCNFFEYDVVYGYWILCMDKFSADVRISEQATLSRLPGTAQELEG